MREVGSAGNLSIFCPKETFRNMLFAENSETVILSFAIQKCRDIFEFWRRGLQIFKVQLENQDHAHFQHQCSDRRPGRDVESHSRRQEQTGCFL